LDALKLLNFYTEALSQNTSDKYVSRINNHATNRNEQLAKLQPKYQQRKLRFAQIAFLARALSNSIGFLLEITSHELWAAHAQVAFDHV